jgi:1,5-anhydro-D-fructose reductase (1,5-anhydro-D-mannitol-forming)
MPIIERETVRWGIVGCGNVTEVKSGPGFKMADGSTLGAVMRRNGELAADYAQRHNVPRWYDDADKLINDPEIDAVYIATPPGTHCEYALRVAQAGKPAYIEKPMARSYVECQQMNQTFADANLPLYVAYYRRGLPRFRTAKALIDEGRLGTITSVSYRMTQRLRERDPRNLPWRLDAADAGGGLFLDLGSHTLDILDFLLGPLQHVAGSAANLANDHDVEDVVALSFQTPTGAVGTASWNFAGSHAEDIIRIDGTQASLTMTTFGNEELQLQTAQGVETFDGQNPKTVQAPLIQMIVDDLRGRGTSPSTGESAARTQRVMDIALESYYGSREDEFWTRPQSWPGRRQRS